MAQWRVLLPLLLLPLLLHFSLVTAREGVLEGNAEERQRRREICRALGDLASSRDLLGLRGCVAGVCVTLAYALGGDALGSNGSKVGFGELGDLGDFVEEHFHCDWFSSKEGNTSASGNDRPGLVRARACECRWELEKSREVNGEPLQVWECRSEK